MSEEVCFLCKGSGLLQSDEECLCVEGKCSCKVCRVANDPLRSTRMQLEHSPLFLICHDELSCRNEYCTLHNRSNHSMRSFPQHWRSDRGIMERICPHGIGHPDPDEINEDRTHGCDGCCDPDRGDKNADSTLG